MIMKTMFRIYIVVFVLLSDFMMFAQPPTEDEDGDLQDDDTPATFINQKIIWLVIAALMLAWYKLKQHRQDVTE